MKISEPPDYSVYWYEDKILMRVFTHLYLDEVPKPPEVNPFAFPLQIDISGVDTRTRVVHDSILKHIPGAMEAIEAWIDRVGIMEKWEEEASAYREVMRNIDLPGISPTTGSRRLYYAVKLEAPGKYRLPALQVHVTTAKGEASYQLQMETDEDDKYGNPHTTSICRGELRFPITMASIKTAVQGPMEQYIAALWSI